MYLVEVHAKNRDVKCIEWTDPASGDTQRHDIYPAVCTIEAAFDKYTPTGFVTNLVVYMSEEKEPRTDVPLKELISVSVYLTNPGPDSKRYVMRPIEPTYEAFSNGLLPFLARRNVTQLTWYPQGENMVQRYNIHPELCTLETVFNEYLRRGAGALVQVVLSEEQCEAEETE
jgi:hypothetical protein